MSGLLSEKNTIRHAYREESPRKAVVAAVFVVVMVGVPLVFANKKISEDGAEAADVSRYAELVKVVDDNVRIVQSVLENGTVDESLLDTGSGITAKGSTVITPPVAPTNAAERIDDSDAMEIVLTAIFWNSRQPLVTINGDNHYVGDRINGFTILEIRKTAVVFRSPTGEKVVKYFYEDLN